MKWILFVVMLNGNSVNLASFAEETDCRLMAELMQSKGLPGKWDCRLKAKAK